MPLQDNFGIPQPQRSLAQIQEHARQLRVGAGGASTLGERRAAASLLGASLDTAQLTKKTVDFSVTGARDEGGASEDTWTVEEWMAGAARRNVASTIQVGAPRSLTTPLPVASPPGARAPADHSAQRAWASMPSAPPAAVVAGLLTSSGVPAVSWPPASVPPHGVLRPETHV